MKLVRGMVGLALIGLLGACGAGKDGAAGDPGAAGSSCAVADNGDTTYTIACDDGTTVTLKDGVKGLQGDAGAKGDQGDQGPKGDPGDAGASCTIVDNGDGTKTITCGETTVQVLDGAKGADGASCTVVDDGQGTKTITCGDASVTVLDGAKGDQGDQGDAGASCAVVDNQDGTKTITCGDTSVTVADGAKGDQGDQGDKGDTGDAGASCSVVDNEDGTKTITCGETVVTVTDGAKGDTGDTGASCTVIDNQDGSKTITCGETTVVVTDGKDAEPCTVVRDDVAKTATITCPGSDPVVVNDGADGAKGVDGKPCTILDNLDGTATVTCADGTKTTLGSSNAGAACNAPATTDLDQSGTEAQITNFHGIDYLTSTGEFAAATNPKYFANATITDVVDDGTGAVTITYEVKTTAGVPVTGLSKPSASIDKLTSFLDVTGMAHTQWVPYIRSLATVSNSATGTWPNPDGTKSCQGGSESTGTFVEVGAGVYTYTFAKKLNAYTCDGVATTTYEPTLTHRVVIMMGGHSGATADATFEFVPDGGAVSLTRDIVRTDACKQCHGPLFKGHGGNRLQVQTCVMCHNPNGGVDPQGGESIDMATMIHKIHAGEHLEQVSGADGIFYDNPTTTTDESADNGEYAIWGYGNSKHEWHGEFPAVLANCTKCHYGSGADVDNWKMVPSRAACGSCHDTVDFAVGTNHLGGKQTSDAGCALCHEPADIVEYHDWTTKDVRNIPEFDLELSVSAPANGKWFVKGEAPVITVVVKDGGVVADHTALFVEDATKESCTAAVCPKGDGKLATSALFVTGPRANRQAAITYAARAKVIAAAAGPYDLSAATSLIVVVDNGQGIAAFDGNNGDSCQAGVITVTVPATGAFADKAAATKEEVVAWLNADAKFKTRAIAYVDEVAGKPAIRSRNLGALHSVQLKASTVATAVFGVPAGQNGTLAFAGYSNVTAKRTNAANQDPKVTYFADKITYQLDPVDDLQAGTYVVGLEFADIGRTDVNVYKTPSVARASFDVNPMDDAAVVLPEKQVAGNCNSCHQNAEGKGFILDFSRHNKPFGANAIDFCASCHDNAPSTATGTKFSGGGVRIAKRVHAVHMGAELNYPMTTVQYSNGDPVAGRNWQIEFPQDIRNCEACHPASTSGSWKSMPGRLVCGSCHDGDDATAHMNQMTYDPTPANAYSGDETESCHVCH